MTDENAAAMHCGDAGEAQTDLPICQHCRKPFTARRGWQAFCTTPCRTAFHSRQAKAIRDRAPAMFAALQKIAVGPLEGHESCASVAAAAIKGLKAP